MLHTRLAKEGSDPLCSLGNFNVQQLLDSPRVAELVCHHPDRNKTKFRPSTLKGYRGGRWDVRNIVEAVKVRESLCVCLVFDEFLCASVEKADMRIRPKDLFTVELWKNYSGTVDQILRPNSAAHPK
jgi:hypothetical protein